jgi:hypothetical protein
MELCVLSSGGFVGRGPRFVEYACCDSTAMDQPDAS